MVERFNEPRADGGTARPRLDKHAVPSDEVAFLKLVDFGF
jgi:hypothetical protein